MRLDADRTEEISENLEPPTFNNTVLALEQSGALLGQLNEAFYMVVGANNNDVLEKKTEKAVSEKFSEHQSKLLRNPKLFARIQAVYDQRKKLGLDDDQVHLVER